MDRTAHPVWVPIAIEKAADRKPRPVYGALMLGRRSEFATVAAGVDSSAPEFIRRLRAVANGSLAAPRSVLSRPDGVARSSSTISGCLRFQLLAGRDNPFVIRSRSIRSQPLTRARLLADGQHVNVLLNLSPEMC